MTDPARADMIVALFGDALDAVSDGGQQPRTEAAARKAAELLSEWSARYPHLLADFTGVAVEAVVSGQWPVASEDHVSAGEDVPTDRTWIADQVRQIRRAMEKPELELNTSPQPSPWKGEGAGTLYQSPSLTNGRQRPAVVRKNAAGGLRAVSVSRGIGFPDELAARLRLPPAVLERLAGNQLDPKSLPVVLIQQLATILQAHRRDIAEWLAGPAATGHAGMYPAMVSEARAPYGSTTRFSDVVSEGDDWADADREFWRSAIRFSRLTEEPGGARNDEP